MEHGKDYIAGISMRTVPTQMGAARDNRGTKGMPEMQKPVLEHAASETREEEITRETGVVKLVTNVTSAWEWAVSLDDPRIDSLTFRTKDGTVIPGQQLPEHRRSYRTPSDCKQDTPSPLTAGTETQSVFLDLPR
jgi:hypothetical protein